MKKLLTSIVIALSFISLCFSETRISSLPHLNAVNSILFSNEKDSKSFFSIGKDGFIIKWNPDNSGEHFQITENQIKFSAISPIKDEIAIYETNGSNVNIISVFDWNTLSKKYSINLTDSILSLSYSKKGTYLIAGTATDKGTLFIKTADGKIAKPISDSLNMMAFTETAASEKTLMTYSLMGYIYYYDLNSGKLLKKIPTEKNLDNVTSFAKNKYIAAVKDKQITIIDALSGKIEYQIKCISPVLFSYNENLYYYESVSARTGSIFTFDLSEGKFSNPVIYKNISFPQSAKVSSIKMNNSNIIFGDIKGNIFKSDLENTDSTLAQLISDSQIERILDTAIINEKVYLLTKNSIFCTKEMNRQIEKISDNPGFTSMISHDGNLILWDFSNNSNVKMLDTENNNLIPLFKSKGQILLIKSAKNKLLTVESSTNVYLYDFTEKKNIELYYGSGIHDAELVNDSDLYIAKSSFNENDSSLLYVNTKTHETVPLKTEASYIYALSSDSVSEDSEKTLFAIGIIDESKKHITRIYKLNTENKKTETLYEIPSIDTMAFLTSYNGYNFTNLGSPFVTSIMTKGKSKITYRRTASLPKKVVSGTEKFIILNSDGSISWLSQKSPAIEADWYISGENSIVSY